MAAVDGDGLDDVLQRRRSRSRRAAGIGVVVVAALLAAALVLHTALVARMFVVPTPIVMTQRPTGVEVLSNLGFGTLTLNGRQLHGPPPQAVRLRDGTNTITLASPPFATRRCLVTWPDLEVLSGRCSVSVGYVAAQDPRLDVEYEIALDVDGRDLPPSAAASALATANAAVSTVRLQTSVPADQRVASGWTPRTGAIASLRVAQPAQAQLVFAPASAPDCPAGLCAGPEFIPGYSGGGAPPLGAPVWMLYARISYTWRFVAASGDPLASITYPSNATVAIALVPGGDGEGGWHVWQPTPPATDGALALADSLAATVCDWASVFRVALPGVPSPANVATTIGPGIEGCVFQLQSVNGQLAGSLVWRFGVLLAADNLAHARYPVLPLASSGEIRAVVGR